MIFLNDDDDDDETHCPPPPLVRSHTNAGPEGAERGGTARGETTTISSHGGGTAPSSEGTAAAAAETASETVAFWHRGSGRSSWGTARRSAALSDTQEASFRHDSLFLRRASSGPFSSARSSSHAHPFPLGTKKVDGDQRAAASVANGQANVDSSSAAPLWALCLVPVANAHSYAYDSPFACASSTSIGTCGPSPLLCCAGDAKQRGASTSLRLPVIAADPCTWALDAAPGAAYPPPTVVELATRTLRRHLPRCQQQQQGLTCIGAATPARRPRAKPAESVFSELPTPFMSLPETQLLQPAPPSVFATASVPAQPRRPHEGCDGASHRCECLGKETFATRLEFGWYTSLITHTGEPIVGAEGNGATFGVRLLSAAEDAVESRADGDAYATVVILTSDDGSPPTRLRPGGSSVPFSPANAAISVYHRHPREVGEGKTKKHPRHVSLVSAYRAAVVSSELLGRFAYAESAAASLAALDSDCENEGEIGEGIAPPLSIAFDEEGASSRGGRCLRLTSFSSLACGCDDQCRFCTHSVLHRFVAHCRDAAVASAGATAALFGHADLRLAVGTAQWEGRGRISIAGRRRARSATPVMGDGERQAALTAASSLLRSAPSASAAPQSNSMMPPPAAAVVEIGVRTGDAAAPKKRVLSHVVVSNPRASDATASVAHKSASSTDPQCELRQAKGGGEGVPPLAKPAAPVRDTKEAPPKVFVVVSKSVASPNAARATAAPAGAPPKALPTSPKNGADNSGEDASISTASSSAAIAAPPTRRIVIKRKLVPGALNSWAPTPSPLMANSAANAATARPTKEAEERPAPTPTPVASSPSAAASGTVPTQAPHEGGGALSERAEGPKVGGPADSGASASIGTPAVSTISAPSAAAASSPPSSRVGHAAPTAHPSPADGTSGMGVGVADDVSESSSVPPKGAVVATAGLSTLLSPSQMLLSMVGPREGLAGESAVCSAAEPTSRHVRIPDSAAAKQQPAEEAKSPRPPQSSEVVQSSVNTTAVAPTAAAVAAASPRRGSHNSDDAGTLSTVSATGSATTTSTGSSGGAARTEGIPATASHLGGCGSMAVIHSTGASSTTPLAAVQPPPCPPDSPAKVVAIVSAVDVSSAARLPQRIDDDDTAACPQKPPQSMSLLPAAPSALLRVNAPHQRVVVSVRTETQQSASSPAAVAVAVATAATAIEGGEEDMTAGRRTEGEATFASETPSAAPHRLPSARRVLFEGESLVHMRAEGTGRTDDAAVPSSHPPAASGCGSDLRRQEDSDESPQVVIASSGHSRPSLPQPHEHAHVDSKAGAKRQRDGDDVHVDVDVDVIERPGIDRAEGGSQRGRRGEIANVSATLGERVPATCTAASAVPCSAAANASVAGDSQHHHHLLPLSAALSFGALRHETMIVNSDPYDVDSQGASLGLALAAAAVAASVNAIDSQATDKAEAIASIAPDTSPRPHVGTSDTEARPSPASMVPGSGDRGARSAGAIMSDVEAMLTSSEGIGGVVIRSDRTPSQHCDPLLNAASAHFVVRSERRRSRDESTSAEPIAVPLRIAEHAEDPRGANGGDVETQSQHKEEEVRTVPNDEESGTYDASQRAHPPNPHAQTPTDGTCDSPAGAELGDSAGSTQRRYRRLDSQIARALDMLQAAPTEVGGTMVGGGLARPPPPPPPVTAFDVTAIPLAGNGSRSSLLDTSRAGGSPTGAPLAVFPAPPPLIVAQVDVSKPQPLPPLPPQNSLLGGNLFSAPVAPRGVGLLSNSPQRGQAPESPNNWESQQVFYQH